MTEFALHPRLATDTRPVGNLTLSSLRLMNDRRFPWCILVPRRSGLRELHDLPDADQQALLTELNLVSLALLEHCSIDKINVGALGNLVPQLHVHVVGRREGDDAWPGPVWGHGQALGYGEEEASRLVAILRDACGIRSAQ